MFHEQKMTSLEAPEFWRVWKKPKRGQNRTGRGQKKPGRGQKRPGRGQEKARRGQESRIWRKIARNVIFYEQKMTSLGAPEFWRESKKSPKRGQKRPGRGQKRPGRGQKRPGRGQEKARRGQEEARRGPEKPGIQTLAKNCSKHNIL